MYYHLSVKNTKQLSSLKGRFRNACEEENCFIFMISQSPHQLDFIAVTAMFAEVLEDPGHKLRRCLDRCLYSLIQDHVLRENFSYTEIDQQLFINQLVLSIAFHHDITDICTMSGQFDMTLEEKPSHHELLNVEGTEEFKVLKAMMKEIDLSTNLFLVNVKPLSHKEFVIAHLIHQLIEQHQAISTDTIQLRFAQQDRAHLSKLCNNSRFLSTVSGKLLLISLDYAKFVVETPEEFNKAFIAPVKELSTHVPVLVMLDKILIKRAAENLARQLNSTIITDM